MASEITDLPDNPPIGVLDAPFDSALSERYLVYALSTITARSLPDVRDGLKPVHRRLLWAMRLLRMAPGDAYKKSARVVGDVIGKYHPHGDQSVYDAMVRLAQDFSLRYPLVDGQGNFGNIDGDNAAAYRYTEARLTQVAQDLMDGLDEDAVGFRATYNGEDQEPELMPGLFPNLLANGAAGIAVGMATSIPPHNAAELLDAAVALIDNPNADVLEYVKGPDLPTGGLIVDSPAAIAEAYATGRGSFRTRARIEQVNEKGGGWHLVVTEIPYGVSKGKLIENIADLINDKKLPILADVRDESAEDIRIVLEPRSRTVDPDTLMESLFRLSDLETRVPLNLNVLDATRTPRVMSLKEALAAWVDHQFVVLRRRSQHRLDKIADRLELLGGYLIAFLNLDRVIEIIRTEDEPKPVMIAEFELTDRQAEAILNMRLRSLRRLEEMEIRKERDGLEKEQGELELLLSSDARQRTRLKRDLGKVRERYGPETALGKRRTTIEEAAPAREIPLEAMIEREPITVILSQRGWIRAMKGHVELDRRRRDEVQGRRRPALRVPRADHRQAAARRGDRAVLHARRRQAARRARVRRAGAADDRPRRRGTDHRVAPRERGRALAGRGAATGAASCSRPPTRSPRRARARRWSIRAPARSSSWSGRSAPRTITSRRSATIARCWSSRSPKSPNWPRGRGCSCSAIATAGWPTR